MVCRTDAVDIRYRTVYDKDMEKGTRVYGRNNGEFGTVECITEYGIEVKWDGNNYLTYGYTEDELMRIPSPRYRDLL